MKLYDARDIVDLIIIYLFQIASQLFNDDIRTGTCIMHRLYVIYLIYRGCIWNISNIFMASKFNSSQHNNFEIGTAPN